MFGCNIHIYKECMINVGLMNGRISPDAEIFFEIMMRCISKSQKRLVSQYKVKFSNCVHR